MTSLLCLYTRTTAMLCMAAALSWSTVTAAGGIALESFLQFGSEGGAFATGCDPADPLGAFCTPSFGTPTGFLDAPPWTFTAAQAVTLIVVDVFEAGDRFQVRDFGSPVGLTSAPVGNSDCGDDPVPCLSDPAMSKGSFELAAGDHSITIFTLTDAAATGYLKVTAVPEPATALVIVLGAAVLGWRQRKQRIR